MVVVVLVVVVVVVVVVLVVVVVVVVVVEVRRVDLANWTLRTSPKFTTGVKYQFHQGF